MRIHPKTDHGAKVLILNSQNWFANAILNIEATNLTLVYCVRSPFTLNVISGLTRSPMISTGFLPSQE